MKTLDELAAGDGPLPQQENTPPTITVIIKTADGGYPVNLVVPDTCEYLPGGRLAHLEVPEQFVSIEAAQAYLMPPESRARDFPVSSAPTPFVDPSGEISTPRGLFYAERFGLF